MSGIALNGFIQLQRNFDNLRGKVARRVMRKSLSAAGSVLLKHARRNVHVDTGLLKFSLGKKVWTSRDKKTLGVVIGPRNGVGEVRGGTFWTAWQIGYWEEFGTYSNFNQSAIGPHSFLRVAVNSGGSEAFSKMTAKAKTEIRKEAARLRK